MEILASLKLNEIVSATSSQASEPTNAKVEKLRAEKGLGDDPYSLDLTVAPKGAFPKIQETGTYGCGASYNCNATYDCNQTYNCNQTQTCGCGY